MEIKKENSLINYNSILVAVVVEVENGYYFHLSIDEVCSILSKIKIN